MGGSNYALEKIPFHSGLFCLFAKNWTIACIDMLENKWTIVLPLYAHCTYKYLIEFSSFWKIWKMTQTAYKHTYKQTKGIRASCAHRLNSKWNGTAEVGNHDTTYNTHWHTTFSTLKFRRANNCVQWIRNATKFLIWHRKHFNFIFYLVEIFVLLSVAPKLRHFSICLKFSTFLFNSKTECTKLHATDTRTR